ncbi:MAG: TRAP transporter large permease subunit, partial [Burkholderiaceae bacterium]
MSDPAVAILLLCLFIVVIFLGFPIAFTLMAMGIGFGFYAYFDASQAFWDNRIFYLFTQNTFSVMNNDVLISIPLFLFMGYIIERANILDRLFLSLQVGLRFLPGSMAVAALITCALFATATGIVGAVVTLMGLIALPAMLKAG